MYGEWYHRNAATDGVAGVTPSRTPLHGRRVSGNRLTSGNPLASKDANPKEDEVMAEPTLYERLGGIFAIAAVVDSFSDRLLKNPRIVEANPELHEWHTEAYTIRLPGLKWLRTLWLASLAGGPFRYTGRELRDAHFDLKIAPAVFDEVAAELRGCTRRVIPDLESSEQGGGGCR
jgi:hemoglobin